MAIPPDTDLSADDTRRDLKLSALALVGPSLWIGVLSAIYVASHHECGAPRAAISGWLTIAAALCIACALAAIATMRRRFESSATAPSKAARVRFMIHVGLALNALSLLLLVGFAAPLLTLRPCE